MFEKGSTKGLGRSTNGAGPDKPAAVSQNCGWFCGDNSEQKDNNTSALVELVF